MTLCCKIACLLLLGLAWQSLHGTTWYVRHDGGTRYSAHAPKGQCDGKTNAAYVGSESNQHCAFNDIRYLWTDGSYSTDPKAGAPAWGWIGTGETLISSTALECQNLAAGSVKVDQTPAIHLDCMAIHLPREHLHRPLALPRLIHKSLESTTRPATPQERKPVSTGDLPPGMCFRCRDHLTWILPAWTSLILQVAADKGRLMGALRPIRWMISRQTESDGQIHRRKIRSQTSKFTEWADPECWAPRETVW